MLGHYAQYMASDYYASWFRGYAFGVVAVFFVLAGHGAFFSLRKRLGANDLKGAMPAYYLDRALRIYPLYWVALLLTASYFPEYELAYRLDVYTIAIYLAVPFVNAPGIFWFVPAIVLCYLLAPFIYRLLAKVGVGRFLAIALGTVPLSLAVSFFYLSSVDPDAGIFSWSNLNILFYKHYFLSPVLLFSLGLAMAEIISRYRLAPRGKILLGPAVFLFVLLLFLTRGSYSFYHQQYDSLLILLAPMFIASCFTLCLAAIAADFSVPLAGVLGDPGRLSYPLYLFHMLYIALLARFGLIRDNDLRSLLVFLMLLPLLVLLFHGIEHVYSGGRAKDV